ncbi:MAG: PA0069 family radical SAM protein [Planctomycetaceae bacterium]
MRHGSKIDPPNRFEKVHRELDFEHVEWDQEYLAGVGTRPVEYVADASKSVISENDSPDVPFRYSLNPYRGCQHGCAYCYARNSHEYLGYNAGLDFETKIVVKHEAPALFRDFLARDSWQPQVIVFSGVTDCYQPAERQFRLTRGCLEVALACRQPIGIVTKNALVVRDLDLLSEMASQRLVQVNVSVTTLDAELARVMEPRTSIPSARLRAIEMLSQAGVPTRIMVAPVIPGLNDSEIPAILASGRESGATSAAYVLLRLPLTVEPVFREWLERTQPLKAQKIESLIRETRAGQFNRSEWGTRMTGTGQIAEHVRNVFQIFAKKHGLNEKLTPFDFSRFQPPRPRNGQLRLF